MVKKKIGFLIVLAVLIGNPVIAKEWDRKFFLDLNAGYSFSPYKFSGDMQSIDKLDENAVVYGAGLGYRYSDNYFFTMNYTQQKLESIEFNNFYASANFRFRFKRSSFAPYIGLMAGMSTMHWVTLPVSSTSPVKDSTAFMWGVQVGDEYLLTRWLQIYGAYQYTNAIHKTEIIGLGTVEYQANNSLIVGVRISFIDPE